MIPGVAKPGLTWARERRVIYQQQQQPAAGGLKQETLETRTGLACCHCFTSVFLLLSQWQSFTLHWTELIYYWWLNCKFSYKTYCCIEKNCTWVTKLFKCNCVQSAPEKCKVEKSSEPSDKGPISDKMSVLKFLELLKPFNVKVPFKSFMLLFSDTATSQI